MIPCKVLLLLIGIQFFLLHNVNLFAQDQPYWVKHATIPDANKYYFGIGYSDRSRSEADDKARIEFSKMIEVDVISKTEYELKEKNYKLDDRYKVESRVLANMKLKGIAIHERWQNTATGQYYSLIKYEKDEYENILISDIRREINLLSEQLRSQEKKAAEELRHKQEMDKINEEKARAEMESQRRKEILNAEKKRRRSERESLIFQEYQHFYKKPIPPFLIDISNAIVGFPENQVILKPTLYPFSFIQANYNHNWSYLGFSFGLYWNNKELQLQDAHLKLKIFRDHYGIYPIAIAIGLVQYSKNISNFSDLSAIKPGVTPSLYTNASIPQLYSHTTLYLDARKISFGIQYHPFFEHFAGKLYVLVQNDMIFMKEFRNRFNDRFLVQPGIGFEVVPGALFLLFSYEDNEFITLTLDYKF